MTSTDLARWAPGVAALRVYQRGWLSRDIVAGAVLCALLVPQGMAYAELAGLPPITGLYTTIACLVAYALLGPSPSLVLGPDSSLGPMIAAVVLPLAAGSSDQAVALAGALAILVGIVCAAAGLARLGFVTDLLSRPVRVGYLAGLAVTIFVGQLPKLFGFGTDASGFVDEVVAFVKGLDQTNVWALGVGLLSVAIVIGLRRAGSRIPGVLVAVVVSMVLAITLDLGAKGVDLVGSLPQGFPLPSLPHVALADLGFLAVAAIGISLVAMGDTISTSAGFASRRGERVDSDQELRGIGAANIAAGFFQGFPVSTSGSRTAVAEQAGAKTQVTGLVAAGLVLTMLLVLPGLVASLPQPTLAAVVITASLSLFDVAELRLLWRMRRSEFLVAVACALGVILAGVLQGIVIAVVIAILQVFVRAWRPHSAVLGQPAGVPGYHDTERYPDATLIPGLLMLRWDAPLFFANANLFRDMVEARLEETSPRPEWVIIAAEPVTDIDTTAIVVLAELEASLDARGVRLVFAELKDPVRLQAVQYGVSPDPSRVRTYPTIAAAVTAFEGRGASPAEPPGDDH